MASYYDQQDYQSPLSNAVHKRRQVPLDPNDELICNNCINSELINAKNYMNRAYNYGESPLDIQDRLNKLTQTNIMSKVQQRIQISEKLGSGMGRMRSADKERFINGNEKGTFFLNDSNLLSNDVNKQKALDRYNRTQINNSGLTKSALGKKGVDDYYRNCVDNYVAPKEQLGKSKTYLQQNYLEALDNQISTNQKLKSKLYRNEDSKKREEMYEDQKKYQNEQTNLASQQRRLKEDFMNGNQTLITTKNARTQKERMADDNQERKNASALQQKLDNEERNKILKEENKKQQLQKDLEYQIKEKERRKALEKNQDKPSSYEKVIGSCTCQGTGTCSNCKKNYPLSFLNPKRNYMDLARRKKQNS